MATVLKTNSHLKTEYRARTPGSAKLFLAGLAAAHGVPLHSQGPRLIFHTVKLKPGAAARLINDYRDYVRRHDAPRSAHLCRCLLEEGVSAIERGLWSVSLAHHAADIDEALAVAAVAMKRYVETAERGLMAANAQR